ncbi:MAG TPA: hypothetical protein VFC25_17045 [Verrucomicrobiae bacterium]|nr:hypothetical protein [Verrucomicrobiae bacterium]
MPRSISPRCFFKIATNPGGATLSASEIILIRVGFVHAKTDPEQSDNTAMTTNGTRNRLTRAFYMPNPTVFETCCSSRVPVPGGADSCSL